MNMYEMNKIGYAGLPEMTVEEIQQSIPMIRQFLSNNPSNYYMLLNNECKYYTVFKFVKEYKFKEMAAEIISIVLPLGKIKSIELAEGGQAMEFWIDYDDECRVFYLFDYERGVIEV